MVDNICPTAQVITRMNNLEIREFVTYDCNKKTKMISGRTKLFKNLHGNLMLITNIYFFFKVRKTYICSLKSENHQKKQIRTSKQLEDTMA